MKKIAYVLPTILMTPLFALAAGDVGSFSGIGVFITNVTGFINTKVLPAIFALAFLSFVWGVVQAFVFGGSDPAKQKSGKELIKYSIAAFVIMVSLWGIVNIISQGFGFQGETINIPDLPKK